MEIPSFFFQTVEGLEWPETLSQFFAGLLSQTKSTTAFNFRTGIIKTGCSNKE
jgi:hypothetical protein